MSNNMRTFLLLLAAMNILALPGCVHPAAMFDPDAPPAKTGLTATGASSATGLLDIDSGHADVRIFVDGELQGLGQAVLEVAPGRHRVVLELQEHEPYERIVVLNAGSVVQLKPTLHPKTRMGRLAVSTEPADATVRIMLPGPDYREDMEMAPGRYQLMVEKDGFLGKEFQVEVKPGERLEVDATLPPVSEQQASDNGTPAGRFWIDPRTGMTFIRVQGGCFFMGCDLGDDSCEPDEQPRRAACVDGFWMGAHEVTKAQWRTLMRTNPAGYKAEHNPVENVSWAEIQEFVRRCNEGSSYLVFRLPTETEWEYACRSGGQDERWSGGEDVDLLAWHYGNSRGTTRHVGTKRPNGLGLYDMSGNVWEMTKDIYSAAPEEPMTMVVRGGGFRSTEITNLRCGKRWSMRQDRGNMAIGFRLVAEPTRPDPDI